MSVPWQKCPVNGCDARLRQGVRRNGLPRDVCCNACRHQDAFHSENCDFSQQPTVWNQPQGHQYVWQQMNQPATVGQPWNQPQGHQPTTRSLTWTREYQEFHLNPNCVRDEETKGIFEFVRDDIEGVHLLFDHRADDLWKALHLRVSPNRSRAVRIWAVKQELAKDVRNLFDGGNTIGMIIDVDSMGLNAQFPYLFKQEDVTGVDGIVQAVLLKQAVMPRIIEDAVAMIENSDLAEFMFSCTGATHRSLGAAILLVRLIYQNGSVVVTTKRTQKAANRSTSMVSCRS